METMIKNVGLIEVGNATIASLLQDVSRSNGYQVKKIMASEKSSSRLAKDHYPEAELVNDSNSIINDSTIELIIIAGTSDNDLGVISQALGAGKQVRVL